MSIWALVMPNSFVRVRLGWEEKSTVSGLAMTQVFGLKVTIRITTVKCLTETCGTVQHHKK